MGFGCVSLVSVDDCDAFVRWQRCREYNRWNLVFTEPFENALKINRHIGVISVTFVNNNDLVGQPEVT